MEIYLVGGAVRDRLLGLPHHEKDWVVIGSTPAEMLSLGFKPVGKDFPVFLHPQTHEEYALARTERKTGRGYTQFTFYASPDVTLEEDLRRRDLTINAMAMTEAGEIIDPYGGQQDLKLKMLRHVSPAFVEDPVRILRIARLMARFAPLGFTIAPETSRLMSTMVKNGEVDALVSDRVWREYDQALSEAAPLLFFEVLYHCGALQKLFPEFVSQVTSPTLSSPSRNEVQDKCQPAFRKLFQFVLFTLRLTQTEIKTLCKRYPIPTEYRELALIANNIQTDFYQKKFLSEEILNLLEKADAFRRDKRFMHLLEIFKDSPHLKLIQKAFHLTQKISTQPFIQQGYAGKILGDKIRAKRLEVIKTLW